MHGKRGYTIVELLVVLTIVSLLSSFAFVLVRLPLRSTQVELAVEQIKSLDALARSVGKRGDAVLLQIEPRENRFRLIATPDTILSELKLPRDARISRMFVLNRPPVRSTVELHYELSTSATYGLLIGARSTSFHWLIICGLSGEVYRFDEAKGDEFIARLSKSTSDIAY